MLRPAQICKKCTIFVNLRTISQEGKKETRQMTPFFSSTFWTLFAVFIFVFEKCKNLFSWGTPFGPFWSVKYLHFGGESCEIRILSCSIQETYTLRKVKKTRFYFFNRAENQICLISGSIPEQAWIFLNNASASVNMP